MRFPSHRGHITTAYNLESRTLRYYGNLILNVGNCYLPYAVILGQNGSNHNHKLTKFKTLFSKSSEVSATSYGGECRNATLAQVEAEAEYRKTLPVCVISYTV